MPSDTLTISKCPKCGKSHDYQMKVERDFIIRMMTSASFGGAESITRRKFTRLFTCPSTNDDFEATISLEETSSDRIRSVTIIDNRD